MTLCSSIVQDDVISAAHIPFGWPNEEIFLKALWHFNSKRSWSKYETSVNTVNISDINMRQYMKFRNKVYKLSSGGARQILRLISTGGTQSR